MKCLMHFHDKLYIVTPAAIKEDGEMRLCWAEERTGAIICFDKEQDWCFDVVEIEEKFHAQT